MFGAGSNKSKGEKKRVREAVRSRVLSAASRDIGSIPPTADPARRAAGEADLRTFAEVYFPGVYFIPWSPDHLKVLTKMERAVREGGQFALAMARGSGKTSIAITATIWALLNGHHAFVVLIGSTEKAARELLAAVKAQLSRNEMLASDYPEVCKPIQALEGDARRCAGQLSEGKKTRITWTDETIVLPTIEGSKASGSIVSSCGLTGRIRGRHFTLPDGTVARPSLVIVDDAQTTESARSASQVQQREQLLSADVLGLAGPAKQLTAIALCTVIARGDLSERLLDRKANPNWGGERMQMLYSLPSNMTLWEKYAELRNDSLRADGSGEEATAFYIEHKADMDSGALVAWPERYGPGEVSGLQHAMNLRIRDPDAFESEFQNQPKEERTAALALKPEAIASRVNGLARGVAPTTCNVVTVGIDVGDALLNFVAVAWDQNAGGALIEYGTWPRQSRAYFTSREIAEGAGPTLASTSPGAGREGAVAAGLRALLADLFARKFIREDGAALTIDRVLVDSGYLPTVVHQTIRASGRAGLVWPSRGVGIGASARPFSEYRRQPGEMIGNEWMVPLPSGAELRTVRLDSNFWKTFCADRLSSAPGDKGSVMLFGSKPADHRLLCDHFCAEFAVPVEGRGRKLSEWRERPGHHDNHFLDALVMAAVGGSMIGVGAPPRPAPPPPRGPRPFRVLT